MRGFELLDKWKRCERDVGPCLVFEVNRSRAENSGFPSVMEQGKHMGLTAHEVAAVMGWSTGATWHPLALDARGEDFRLINPIARGAEQVDFEDYPEGGRAMCQLQRVEVMPYVSVLSSALAKLPKAHGARLYRGHRRAMPPVGTTVLLRGFTSVSYDMESALSFVKQAKQGRRGAKGNLKGISMNFDGFRGLSGRL